jgi:hypothetical protein
VIVMNLGLFTDPEEVKSGVDDLVRGVRETMDPLPGYDEATTPGTIEHRNERLIVATAFPSTLKTSRSWRQLETSLVSIFRGAGSPGGHVPPAIREKRSP